MLAKVITVICILVWLVNIRHFNDPSHNGWLRGSIYYFKIAVALAVAAIPEGLAVVITTCLALGTKKMAAKNAIVRSLPSVETLGCTSVICSDKTGTLTTNQMSVTRVLTIGDGNGLLNELIVDGTTYAPYGDIRTVDGTIKPYPASCSQTFSEVGLISALCNDSSVSYDEATHSYASAGEPTEAALKCVAEKLGSANLPFNEKLAAMAKLQRVQAVSDHLAASFERLHTLEFSRDRKSMSVIVSSSRGKSLLVKGAPETVLERCTHVRLGKIGEISSSVVPLTSALRETLNQKLLDYGEKLSLRCLALASVESLDEAELKSWDLSDPSKFESYEVRTCLAPLTLLERPGVCWTCRHAGPAPPRSQELHPQLPHRRNPRHRHHGRQQEDGRGHLPQHRCVWAG